MRHRRPRARRLAPHRLLLDWRVIASAFMAVGTAAGVLWILGRPDLESAAIGALAGAAVCLLQHALHRRDLAALSRRITSDKPLEPAAATLMTGVDGLQLALERSQRQLGEMAYCDTLTGLANRQQFLWMLDTTLKTRPLERITVALVDIKRLRALNDQLGHTAADAVLRSFAHRLRNAAASSACTARMDGDEFAILILGGDDRAVAAIAAFADAIHAAMEQPFLAGPMPVDLRVSIGFATAAGAQALSSGDQPTAELMRRADLALTRAKVERLPTVNYDATMERHDEYLLSMLSQLKEAQSNGHLQLHIQPKLLLADRKIHGGEALLRWHGPKGVISPATFIGYAESTGYIRTLTAWVIEQAAQLLAQLRPVAPDFQLSINLSALDFGSIDLCERLLRALHRFGVPPTALVLEITESTFFDDANGALERMAELTRDGFRLALDDFGTGYSSLSYLSRMPLAELKIDKSFIRALGHSQRDTAVVRSIVDLARSFGLDVVAEGVENAASLDLLQTWGCTMVQGYVVAPALPIDALLALLPPKNAADQLTPIESTA